VTALPAPAGARETADGRRSLTVTARAVWSAHPLEALRGWAVQWLSAHQGWLLLPDDVNRPAG